MDSMPDHVLLALFRPSLVQDRLLSLRLVCQRWRALCSYNLAQEFGPVLDTGLFERLSVVGLRNRTLYETNPAQADQFLRHLLYFLFQTSQYADIFQSVRFSTSHPSAKFPQWTVTPAILDMLYGNCPNLESIQFEEARVDPEALPKLARFRCLKHLTIKRVGAELTSVLEQLPLESLRIAGKDAPVDKVQFGNLRRLTVEAPLPIGYFDLLTTLSSSAPYLERIIRKAGGDRGQLPGEIISQIRAHPNLKAFSDRTLFLSDDTALAQLIETKRGQYEHLRVYSEDSLRLSALGQLDKLHRLTVHGNNLEPAELASVFLIPSLEYISVSWTFKDDRNCVLESQSPFADRVLDIRCSKLRTLRMHLDYMSADGRAWGKNLIVNVLQQCPRLKRLRNSDWLLAGDYVQLREVETFVQVVDKIDVNINSATDLFMMLHTMSPLQQNGQYLGAHPISWSNLTTLNVFINENYYVCDLDYLNGDTVPNLVRLKLRSDDEVFFERFCRVSTLPRLTRLEGTLRFENTDAELDFLDELGEHTKFARLATIHTTLTPNMFCDVLMRSRARLREAGHLAPATVIYVIPVTAKRFRPTDEDRAQWDRVAKISYTAGIVLHLLHI